MNDTVGLLVFGLIAVSVLVWVLLQIKDGPPINDIMEEETRTNRWGMIEKGTRNRAVRSNLSSLPPPPKPPAKSQPAYSAGMGDARSQKVVRRRGGDGTIRRRGVDGKIYYPNSDPGNPLNPFSPLYPAWDAEISSPHRHSGHSDPPSSGGYDSGGSSSSDSGGGGGGGSSGAD